ncbi:hypothetical protein WJX73_005472 [Symbiochloris irregularis]|uniref:Uncharacterized protein n=1 Tax=Symbiochloris irregularis TaxID=706552 RepID=A0AAW1NNH8_9CHLO
MVLDYHGTVDDMLGIVRIGLCRDRGRGSTVLCAVVKWPAEIRYLQPLEHQQLRRVPAWAFQNFFNAKSGDVELMLAALVEAEVSGPFITRERNNIRPRTLTDAPWEYPGYTGSVHPIGPRDVQINQITRDNLSALEFHDMELICSQVWESPRNLDRNIQSAHAQAHWYPALSSITSDPYTDATPVTDGAFEDAYGIISSSSSEALKLSLCHPRTC